MKYNKTPDTQGDIYSSDCIDSMKMQMEAMKANSEGIKHNSGGTVFEEVSIITPEMMQELGKGIESFKTVGLDFGDINHSVVVEWFKKDGVIYIEKIV